jgi:HEAT repeat protein
MKPRKEKEVGLLEALLGQVDDYSEQESFEEPAPYEPIQHAGDVPPPLTKSDPEAGDADVPQEIDLTGTVPEGSTGIDQRVAQHFGDEPAAEASVTPEQETYAGPADDEVARSLAGGDVAQRRSALRELLQRELTGPLVSAAAIALQDPEQDLRALSLQVLERAPQLAPLGPVEAATLDWDPGIRARAMALLGRTQNTSVIETLYERLATESDEAVVGAGLTGLAHLLQTVQRPFEAHTIDRVVAIVANLAPTLKARFRRELGLIARVLPEEDLLVRLRSGNAEVRLGAATLALESGSQRSYEALAKGVSDSDAKIRNLATGALSRLQAGQYEGALESMQPQEMAAPIVEPAPPAEFIPMTGEPVAESAPVEAPAPSYDAAPAGSMGYAASSPDQPVEDVVFSALIAALDDPQPEVRSHSEEALKAMEGDRLAKWLRSGIASEDANLKARNADIAARLEMQELVGDIIEAVLASPTHDERVRVAESLKTFTRTWQVIGDMQEDPEPTRRLDALTLVGLIDGSNTEPLIKGLSDPNANVRLAAIEACGTTPSGDVAEQLMALLSTDSSGKARVASVYAFTDADTAIRLRAADTALQSEDDNVRVAAVGLLTGGTEEDVSLLARALHDHNTDVAAQAVAYLGAIPAPEALAVLWSSLRGVSRDVQDLILGVLKDFDRGAVTLLGRQALESSLATDRVLGLRVIARLENRSADRMLAALDDPAPEVRTEALANLLDNPDPTAVDAVGQRLRDPETKVRSMALKVLQAIEDDRVLPYLLDGARDPSKEVRDAAREALLGHSSGSVVELLLRALKFPTHRRAAADLLVQLGEVATDRLLTALKGATPEMRRAIGEILVASDSVGRLMNDLNDRAPAKRLRAVEGIGAMGAIEAVDALISRLDDPDAEVRTTTAKMLGELGDPRAIEPLKRAFIADPDMDVVAAIEPALRRLTGPPSEDEDSDE